MTIKILAEYERGVIFRLGRLIGGKGPGFFLLIPFVDRMVKVDLRVVTMDVPPQDVITKDNVTVRVDAVVYFRVVDPEASVVKVLDYIRATSMISQTTLRNVLGQSELDELLSQREKLNQVLQRIIDEQTDPWGVKVSIVEIKQIELPESMKRSMAAQAEAERERRAKIIHADGEYQASERLAQAGAIIAREPVTLQLRYLQTMVEMASEKSTTIVFPFPMEFMSMFSKLKEASKPVPETPAPPQKTEKTK
ncbi:MAG: slipin family protein [Chloroflexota bacterium]|nr:slipin family protein [Chloroflexota bacterium]